MNIIAIVSRKGGVGKTATALALGSGLQKKRKSVLFIDLDSQYNLTSGVGADPGAVNAFDLLVNNASVSDAIQKTKQCDIIAGSELLSGADAAISTTGKEYRLKESIESLNYDFCIIDTPAQLGILTINALTAANNVIIPAQADIDSLQGIAQLNNSIEAVKKYCNRDLQVSGILITRYNNRSIINRDMRKNLESVAQQINTHVFTDPIRECTAMKESKAMQTNIFDYAPKSNAAIDYESFINEFLKERKRKK